MHSYKLVHDSYIVNAYFEDRTEGWLTHASYLSVFKTHNLTLPGHHLHTHLHSQPYNTPTPPQQKKGKNVACKEARNLELHASLSGFGV